MSATTNGERLLELARDLSCGLMEADEQRELGRLLYDAALWTGNPLRKLSPAGALYDTQAVDLGLQLDRYDAGLLGNGGGGDVNWWQDYIRAELDRAHEFYQEQADAHG